MKKVLSILLAIALLISAVPAAFAADVQEYSHGTQVVFQGVGHENYTITVPAKLTPGQSGIVTLSGVWPSNKSVSVFAESTVTLTNGLLSSDQKVLDISFQGIEKAGNNTVEKTYTENISVEAIDGALFGIWSGTFNYIVDSIQVVPRLEAGLYDANDVLLADWDTLVNTYHLDVELDYDYNPSVTSMDYILTNNPELTTGTKLVVDSSVTKIGQNAFYTCDTLTNIDFEEGSQVASIGDGAFDECRALQSFIFPDSIQTVGGEIFHWGTSLSYIEFEGTMAQWQSVLANSPRFRNYSCWDYGSASTLICSDGSIVYR